MDEINQEEQTKPQVTNKHLRKWMKPVFTLIGVLALILIICLSFLYLKSFKIQYEPKTIAQYWSENNLENKFIANGSKIEVEVPEEVISTEVMLLIKRMKFPSYFRVDGIQVNASEERINVNAHVYGIKFPFSLAFHPVIEEENIVAYFSDMVIGDHGIKLSPTTSQKMIHLFFGGNAPIILDSKTMVDVSLVRVNGVELLNDNYVFSIKINDVLIKNDLKKIKDSSNEEILSLFNTSKLEDEKKAAGYIEQSEKLGDKDIEQLINDVLSESEIAKDILLLADMDVVNQIFLKYDKYLKKIDQNQLITIKKEMLTKILTPYSTQIMGSLAGYFINEPLYMNKGQPFQFSGKKQIALDMVVNEQGLKIPSKTRDKLQFCYDITNEVLLISYQLSTDLYLILNKGEVITMTAETYSKNFSYENTGNADYVKDLPTWDGINNEMKTYFQTDQVFIRYMKSDKKYAFVIASASFSYQNFVVFALENKEGVWTIIDENIASLEYFNKKFPQFNLATATEEIQTVEMHNLGDEMFDVIFEDLINKDIIQTKEGYTIDYCSYGNDYIDFLLSDGKEYVYLVYSRYLHTVYDKATALKTWKDVPDIITLQEPPSI